MLKGDTVTYAAWNSIKDTLDYDFATEKQFSYEGLSVDASVKHLANHATTKFLEMFFSNLLLKTNYKLKNRHMHIDYVNDTLQSVNFEIPKSQFDTLECTLEELAVLELLSKNPAMKQKELVIETGKSLSTVKRIMDSLQKKEYIRRVDGKRYGKWEVLA